MTAATVSARARRTERGTTRLVGLDVARCLALLGMVTAHMLPAREPDGGITVAHSLVAGRSAALFAVLAGVSLALMTGRERPVTGRERLARSAGIAVRALVITVIGLLLGALSTGLAVILAYYGLLFVLSLPFVGLRARTLLLLAVGWALVAPVVSQALRPALPAFAYDNPDLRGLGDPDLLLGELLLTGYYPVLPWLAYSLAGMGLGRLALERPRAQAWIAAAGAALAVGATVLSADLTSRAWVVSALLDSTTTGATTRAELLDQIATGMHGNTPRGGGWEWLLVVAPHSSTPLDLLATLGSALLVIGACLLVVGSLDAAWSRRVAVAFGAGTMTLSLYTLHALLRIPGAWPPPVPGSYVRHVVILLGIGAVFVLAGRRGPLEWVVAALSARTTALVRRASRRGAG